MQGLRAWILVCAASLWAQTGEARIEVKDQSGAAIEASGRLRGSGIDRSFQTDRQGVFAFQGLAPGRYRLQVSKDGFASQSINIDAGSGPVTQTVVMALATQTSRIDVVGATPLAGTDLSLDEIPSPVQTANARQIEQSGATDLSSFLNRRLDGVHVNENQENPFQPDVNYRGYTASPLLGTPEGISVYMDGVRQNQPFGDIVAWDLIPKIAIAEVALMPGSNPLFGLNTLGGAISIQTKDGNSQPGATLQLSGGSFGRRAGEFEYGGSNARGLNWYVAGNLYREDGWREFSPSEVRQSFGKVGWQRGKTYMGLSFAYADNWLTGNGLQDTRFLAEHYSSVNTIPDITWNRSPSVNFSARHEVSNRLSLSGVAYFRYIRADTTNGDINDNSFDQSLYNLNGADVAALTAAGYSGFPATGNATTEPFPFWRCIAQGLLHADPSDRCTGLLTNTYNKQHNWGVSGQAAWVNSRNHVIAGAGWDRSSLGFQQGSQFGYLNADRLTITPIAAFADGSTSSDGVPVDTRVDLHGLVNTYSVFATDTITVAKNIAVTVSGRYNRTSIDNADRLPADPSGARGSLTGQDTFGRFNPAAGVTYSPSRYASVYFSYSEASRAPTAIELGCANPEEPCNLPNALVSDPPLKQVIARTFEAGARGSIEDRLHWNFGWFRTVNHDDLLFVASQQTGFGYFSNFGETQRQGVEADLKGKIGKLTLGGGYTLLNATYQSAQTIGGASNSANAGGNITVQPGDRIPQIPQNIFKAYAEYQPFAKLSVDLDFDAVGRSFARGNEDNLHQPDGLYYLGPGFAPGYGVLNLGTHFQASKKIQFFVEINNLLNHRYVTAAQLGPTAYDDAGNFIARPYAPVDGDFPIRTTTFFAPGAPIGAWGGVRIRF